MRRHPPFLLGGAKADPNDVEIFLVDQVDNMVVFLESQLAKGWLEAPDDPKPGKPLLKV
jgi:hypothetical protein